MVSYLLYSMRYPLRFSHQESLLEGIVRKNNFVQGRARSGISAVASPKNSVIKAVPGSSQVIVDSIAIGKDAAKGKEKQDRQNTPDYGLEDQSPDLCPPIMVVMMVVVVVFIWIGRRCSGGWWSRGRCYCCGRSRGRGSRGGCIGLVLAGRRCRCNRWCGRGSIRRGLDRI